MHSSAILHGHHWELRSLTSTTKRPATSGSLKLNEAWSWSYRISEWDKGIRIIESELPSHPLTRMVLSSESTSGALHPRAISRQEESELPDGPSPRNHNPRHPQGALSSKDQRFAYSARPNSGPLLA